MSARSTFQFLAVFFFAFQNTAFFLDLWKYVCKIWTGFLVDFMGQTAGLVNTVMKLQGPLGAGIYLIAERLLASK
jgi:hypothetical protein